jgi:protein-tyrosine phosphatase
MKHVVFVCLGNICRSPLAEALLKNKVKQAELEASFFIDSCGTNGFHNGEAADARTRANAAEHHIVVDSISRQLTLGDIMDADYVITMAKEVQDHVLRFCRTDAQRQKVYPFRTFDPGAKDADVPDPWYNNQFEDVFQIIDKNCDLWLDHLRKDIG